VSVNCRDLLFDWLTAYSITEYVCWWTLLLSAILLLVQPFTRRDFFQACFPIFSTVSLELDATENSDQRLLSF